MLRAFLKDSVIYAIPSFISRGLSLILVPLYTRVLNPADFGSLDLMMVFASLANLTVALEVSQGVARFYTTAADAEHKAAYASAALWFTVACYTIFGILAVAYSEKLSVLVMGRTGLEAVFRIGVAYIWANGLFYLIQNQFRWELRSVHYAIVSLIVSVLTAALAVLMTYVFAWGLAGLLLGMAGGALAGCFYGLWHLRKSFRLQFQPAHLKQMLAFSAPLVPSGIAVFVSQYIDRLMINHYMSLSDVGIYGVGFRMASIVGLVIVGFQGALTPLIYAHYRDPDTPLQLARIFRIFASFALLLFVGISLFANEVLMMFTVPAYYEAANIIVFLVPSILLANMYIFAPGTALEKKTYVILWINVGGAAINMLINVLLIPSFGIYGASVSKLISYGFVFAAYMWYSQRLYYVPHDWKSIAAATTVIGLIAYWVPRIETTSSIALKTGWIGIAIAVILASGLIKAAELKQLKEAAGAFLINKYR